MKRTNWFICLAYPDFDILIPKEEILSSSYISKDLEGGKTIINFDSLVNPNFGNEANSAKNKTQLELNENKKVVLQTSIIPDLISASLSEFKVFGSELGKTLLNRGFISVRFDDKKIQYLTDINAIIKIGKTK